MRYHITLCILTSTLFCKTESADSRFTVRRFTYGDSSTVSLLGHQFGWRAGDRGKTILNSDETKKLMWRCAGEPIERKPEQKAGSAGKKQLLPKTKKNQGPLITPGTDPREDPNLYVYHEEGTRLWGKISYSNTYLFDVSWENDRSPNCLRIINQTGEMLYLDTHEKPQKLSHKRTFRAIPDGEVRRILPPRQGSITLWRRQQNNEPANQLCTTIQFTRATKTMTLKRRNKVIWAELQKKGPRVSA